MPVSLQQRTFNDFEALHEILQNARSEIVQIGRGRMTGTLAHLSIGSTFGISTGSFSTGIRSHGVASGHRWTFGMVLETAGPASALQHPLAAGDVALIAPGHDRYTSLQGRTRYLAAFIEPQELQAYLATQLGAQEAMERPTAVLAADPAAAAANIKALSMLMDTLVERGPTIPDDAADFYKRNILELLTEPIRDASRYQGKEPRSAVKLVAEVDRFLVDAGNRPIHISELCERFNVGRRRLHRAFHEVLGMTPISFLRQKRLGDVHSVLLQGGPDLMIRDVAVAHGFIELGRFAQEYRRLFGELPSTTMRRTRAVQAN